MVFGSGTWGLNCLILSLLITPVRRWLALLCRVCQQKYGRRLADWNWLIKCRRMVGLFSFFYASLHVYFYLDMEVGFDWQEALLDISERHFLWAGVPAFIILLALALTSPKFCLRKMGRHWRRLHRLVYLAILLVVVHFYLSAKLGMIEPIVYGLCSVFLLVERFVFSFIFHNKLPDDDGMITHRQTQQAKPQ